MKRLLDLAVALAAVALLWPVGAILALGVALSLGRPVFFVQERPGLHGRTFRLLKFRTMRDARTPDGRPLPDAARLGGFGRWMRRWSLDELPGFLNVLKGDMSLVGPRPLLPRYLERYTPRQARRHEVKPGMTGWAQVNGRNAITWEEKFELDVWYVEHRSLRLDLRILVLTLGKVIRGEGISREGEATMPEFLGTHGGKRGDDAR